MTFKFLTPFCAALCFAQVASADTAGVAVTFLEGAPKDRFVIEAKGACPLGAVNVEINLATAAAGVIFDTTGSGAGVEVFQPFELVSGAAQVVNKPMIKDGDQAVTLSLSALPLATRVAFTVDVDDTGGGREITVSGSEIAGASVTIRQGSKTWNAPFGTDAKAYVTTGACPA